MLASEQCYLAEIILTQLTIKVPNFGPKNSNFACKSQMSQISFQKMLKSWFRSRSRDFCQICEGFNFGFGQFGVGKKSRFWSPKKVGVLVSENLVLEKKYQFRSRKKSWFWFWKIWSRKKIAVSENLVSEKSLSIGFGQNFGIVIPWFWGGNI